MNHPFLDRLRDRSGLPLLVAHRGASMLAPENTLEAARLAFESGAEAWELDVQLTRDGVPVVLHDESLRRTTDVARRFPDDPRRLTGYRVSDFDWSEVSALDAGSWFLNPGPRSAQEFGSMAALSAAQRDRYSSGTLRIPSLREALELTSQLDSLVNVELKSFPECPYGLLEATLSEIQDTGTASRVLLSSFDHREVARIPAFVPDGRGGSTRIPRAALAWTPLHQPYDYLKNTVGADAYHISAEAIGSESIAYRLRPGSQSLRGTDIRALTERGMPVLVYTVNDDRSDGLAGHLAALGVSGLFTDAPARLNALFASSSL